MICSPRGRGPCSGLAKPSGRSPRRSRRRRPNSTNPEKALTATIRASNPRDQRSDLSLCGALERPRHRAQGARRSRDRDRSDDRDRQGGGSDPPHHDARPFVGRVAVLGMAGLPDRRDAPRRGGWERRSPMRDATLSSPSSASPAKTISTRRTSMRRSSRPPKQAKQAKVARRMLTRLRNERNERNSDAELIAIGYEDRRRQSMRRRKEKAGRPARVTLDAEQSAALRDRLIADLARLQSPDEAADWVHKNLPVKNTLTRGRRRARRGELPRKARSDRSPASAAKLVAATATRRRRREDSLRIPTRSPSLRRSEDQRLRRSSCPRRQLPRRVALRRKPFACATRSTASSSPRNPASSAAGRPTEAHHLRFAQPRALGRKVSDEYTVPVCRLHHRDLHGYGDEASWWAGSTSTRCPIALELWRRSRLTYSLAATWSEPLAPSRLQQRRSSGVLGQRRQGPDRRG